MSGAWDPGQYEKFRGERLQPFFDLAALVRAREAMRVVDLGCGTGEQTAILVENLAGSSALGIDNSEAMLAKAHPRAHDRLAFLLGDIERFEGHSDYDLVFSNAALHWVPDHEALFGRMLASMRPGAQLAVQVPRNDRHPSHALAAAVAAEPPFRDLLGGFVQRSNVLDLERYAALLHEAGAIEQSCQERVYLHLLPRSADVVEWVKGTTLVPYLARLDAAAQESFLAAYRARLLDAVGDRAPYRYTFRRVLLWAMKG